MIPEPLAQLTAQYDSLLAQLDAQTIDIDTAMRQLDMLQVQDAEGGTWTIDPNSDPPHHIYLRTQHDNTIVADPTAFTTTPAGFPPPPNQAHWEPPPQNTTHSPLDWDPNSVHATPEPPKEPTPSLLDRIPRPDISTLSKNKTFLAVLAAIVLLAALFILRGGSSDEQTASQDTTDQAPCPPRPHITVTGLPEGELSQLIACLDGQAVGDGIVRPGAAIAVVTQQSGRPLFTPAAKVPAYANSYGIGSLYLAIRPDTPLPPPVPGIEDPYGVNAAVALEKGLTATADQAPTTRGAVAVAVANLYKELGRNLTPGEPASDTQAPAVSKIIAAGFSDTKPGQPYRPDDPITAAEWTTIVGRAWVELDNPTPTNETNNTRTSKPN